MAGSIPEDTLIKITNGSDDAYFDVENFDELDGKYCDTFLDKWVRWSLREVVITKCI